MVCRINVVEPDSMEMIYAMAVEKLAQIEVPERAHFVRSIYLELARVGSHLFGLWAYANILGFDTVAQWAMYHRDLILDLFEELTGGRVYHIYIWPGGVRRDFPPGFKDKIVNTLHSIGGGGMVRIGPPLYRLPIEVIDKDVNHIASLGVEFRFNTTVGKDILLEDILKEYDAIYLGIGATVSRSTKIKNIEKALSALSFLKANKIAEPVKVGKEIIVIGGGNVAMDVAREALRLRYMQFPNEEVVTKKVSLEDWDELPATEDEIEEAKAEGIQFNPAWGPKEVKVKDGKIEGLLCIKVKSVFDEQGRFNPTFYEEKQMFLEGDMIIEAIGQAPDFAFIPKELFEKLEFTPHRKVKVDENGMTSIPKIFAGGDIVNQNLDAVTAIADAKLAAEGIHRMLRKR